MDTEILKYNAAKVFRIFLKILKFIIKFIFFICLVVIALTAILAIDIGWDIRGLLKNDPATAIVRQLHKTILEDTSDWQVYENAEHGISFRYPDNYKVTEVKEVRSVDRVFDYNSYFLNYDGDLVVTLVGHYQGAWVRIRLSFIHNLPNLTGYRHAATSYNNQFFDFTDPEVFPDVHFLEEDRSSVSDSSRRGQFLPAYDDAVIREGGDYQSYIEIDRPIKFTYDRPWQRTIQGQYHERGNFHELRVISSVDFGSDLGCGTGVIVDEVGYLQCVKEQVSHAVFDSLFFPSPKEKGSDIFHNYNRVWRGTGIPPEVRYYPALMDQLITLRTVEYDFNEHYVDGLVQEYFTFKKSKCQHYNEWKHHGEEVCQKLKHINSGNLLGYISWSDIMLAQEKTTDDLTVIERKDIADIINQYLINQQELRISGRLYPIRVQGTYQYVARFDSTVLELLDGSGVAKIVFPINKGRVADCNIIIDPQKNIDDVELILFSCDEQEYRYNVVNDELVEVN